MTDAEKDTVERLPNIWSCENRYGKCKSAYGCHCAEITNQHHTITTLRAEVERLTEERETIFMDIVDERDAAIARAEKAEAALVKAWVAENVEGNKWRRSSP